MQLVSTTTRRFRFLPIVADSFDPCLVPVLADLHRLLTLTVHSYRRTRVLRFDLNAAAFHPGWADDSLLQRFMGSYHEFLAWLGVENQYVWIREDRPDGRFAYRMVFMLNAAGLDTTSELLDGAYRSWYQAAGPSALFDPCCAKTHRFPLGNGMVVDVNEADWEDAFRYAFRWASCISLAHGVGIQPFGARPFGCSIPASPAGFHAPPDPSRMTSFTDPLPPHFGRADQSPGSPDPSRP